MNLDECDLGMFAAKPAQGTFVVRVQCDTKTAI